jgi:phosphatidylglycerol:prolipoprotein diacylglycerol transferase
MRQILFRINMHQPWLPYVEEPTSGLPVIGSIWLLVALFVGWLAWTFYRKRGTKWGPDEHSALSTFGTVTVVALLAPFFLPMATVPVFGYGAMLLLSFWSAGTYGAWRARQQGIPEKLIWDLAITILMSGIVGARIFYLVQKREMVFADVHTVGQFLFTLVNLPDGGIVLYGGVIGGAIAFLAFCRHHKLSVLNIADIVTPSVFLGVGFGRIGCFLNGCCYGDFCDLPWSVQYPSGTNTFDALVMRGFISAADAATPPMHPSQIYSSINGFLIAILTANFFAVRPQVGSVLALGWILYPILRFLEERVRADELGQFDTGLTISQLISLGLGAMGIIFAIYLAFYGKKVMARSKIQSTT